MNLTKYWSKLSAILCASAIIAGVGVTTVDALGYKPIQITGVRNIDVNYTVSDRNNITDYSGVYKISLCNNCNPASNFVLKEADAGKNGWSNWEGVKRRGETLVSSKVQQGDMTHYQWQIPSEGDRIHQVCAVVADGANSYGQTANVSYPICREVYYDVSPAVISDVVLNGGNHWINTGLIPLTMTVTDNRAGITDILYENGFGQTVPIPREDIKCTLSNHPVMGDGTWTCKIDTTLVTDHNRAKADITFTITDNVGNMKVYNEPAWTMYYDLVKPTGEVTIANDGNGHINSNTGYIDYHVSDMIKTPWIYNSGIKLLTIAVEDGTYEGQNQRTLHTSDAKDPPKAVDGFISDYIIAACSNGATRVFLRAYDKAGNISDKILSNPITCPALTVNDVILTDVVNPGYYTYANPFVDKNWIWDNSPIYGDELGYIEKEPDNTYPHALAGANLSLEFRFKWDGDRINKVHGYYTLTIKDDLNTFNKSITYSFDDKEVTKLGNELIVDTTKMLLKDAPSSQGSNRVYVYLKMTGYIETTEDGKKKITNTVFPSEDSQYGGKIAEITGSVEDYLYFGELN